MRFGPKSNARNEEMSIIPQNRRNWPGGFTGRSNSGTIRKVKNGKTGRHRRKGTDVIENMEKVLSRQDQELAIGVFDSGVGGISTLRVMRSLLPHERFVYYGDMANAPYGTKSPEEVLACVRQVVDRMCTEGIKALVIACNTATSVAAAVLREELTLPVIAMEPALKPAHELRRNGAILVLATPLTLRLEKFERLMERYGDGAVRVPCPGLMELVEAEKTGESHAYLQKLFSAYDLEKVDAIVLGCTHYVFLKDMIRQMVPPHIVLTDGNEGTARQLQRVLAGRKLLREQGEGEVRLMTSGTREHLALMRRMLEK